MATDFDGFRARFPILQRTVYLNSCSQGALSREVEGAVGCYLESWRERGSPWDLWLEEQERARAAIARHIGADVDEIAIVPNASVGVAAIATALTYRPPRARVIISEDEFPTVAHVWLAQANGRAEVRRHGVAGGPEIRWARDTPIDERTLMVTASSISYRTGARADVRGLTELAHRHGAWMFLDDYQRTGTGPIDVHDLDVDFMASGCLKYLLGCPGVAFLYVRRSLIERLEPLVTGWFGRRQPFAFRPDVLDWAPSARRFETGSPPVANLYAARAGLALLESAGVGAVRYRISELASRFTSAAVTNGFDVVTPVDHARRGPLVVVHRDRADDTVAELGRRGVIVSARGHGVRFSFHAYNDEADVDAAIRALAASRGSSCE